MSPEKPEIRFVEEFRLYCDGGEGALGHPLVWMQIPPEQGWVECPYCDCKFIHKSYSKEHQL